MDGVLPVWAQPHRFWQLRDNDWGRQVFTFGFVMPDLWSLRSLEGVRRVGERWGYEWLPGLSHDVQHERGVRRHASLLEVFLRDEHGFASATEMNSNYLRPAPPTAGAPADELLAEFAETHGRLISDWSANAFNLIEVRINEWAQQQQRVERGHEHTAQRRLALTGMPRQVASVHTIDGRLRWAAVYTSLYQRVALELEDLAIRHPRLRRCPLCHRAFVAIRKGQDVCATNIWDNNSRKLVARCNPDQTEQTVLEAESVIHARQRKARWARMNRIRARYPHNDPRTRQAIKEWETWQQENPPPRPRGRPAAAEPLNDLAAAEASDTTDDDQTDL